ncbi:GPW/gp25 family protein [Phytobacter diazotrophicus]
MMYLGMNQQSGVSITDLDHIRQSVRDILITPVGSRINRRDYGSLLFSLIDSPQNAANRLRVYAAVYSALNRWEPRITLSSISIETTADGKMVIELTGWRADGSPLNVSVDVGV